MLIWLTEVQHHGAMERTLYNSDDIMRIQRSADGGATVATLGGTFSTRETPEQIEALLNGAAGATTTPPPNAMGMLQHLRRRITEAVSAAGRDFNLADVLAPIDEEMKALSHMDAVPTSDALIARWEGEIAAGRQPNLEDGMAPEVRAMLARERERSHVRCRAPVSRHDEDRHRAMWAEGRCTRAWPHPGRPCGRVEVDDAGDGEPLGMAFRSLRRDR